MNSNLRPFKEFKPFDGHPVRSLSFCPDKFASCFCVAALIIRLEFTKMMAANC